MMKLNIYFPFRNNLNLAKVAWMLAESQAGPGVDFTVLDNGSTERADKWILQHMPKANWNCLRTETNQTMWDSIRTVEKLERGYAAVAGILHCDTFLFADKWGYAVRQAFMSDPKLGIAGCFGSSGCSVEGYRLDCFTSLFDHWPHGARLYMNQYCSILDGFAMFYNPQFLHDLGQGMGEGYLDQGTYDYDISLESLRLGYHNMVLHIPCTHSSTITATQSDYQRELNEKYGKANGYRHSEELNYAFWLKKWSIYCPVRVNEKGDAKWAQTPPKDNTTFQALLRQN